MYKLKKIVGSNNFSAQFIKIISYYKKIGYNINVLQQTACLVVNPITVGNFAFLFNCTPLGSLDGQNMELRDDIARPHFTRIIEEYKIKRTSLIFYGKACCRTRTLSNACETSSADVFETGNQPFQNHCEFCQTLLQESDMISCLERMYPVNLMVKRCQVVIRQCEGYTQHKPEVVVYC